MTEQDWLCEICGIQNSREEKTCAVCGNPSPAAGSAAGAGRNIPAAGTSGSGQLIKTSGDVPPSVPGVGIPPRRPSTIPPRRPPREPKKPFDRRAFAIACTWTVRMMLWAVLAYAGYLCYSLHWEYDQLLASICAEFVMLGIGVASVAQKVTALIWPPVFGWIADTAGAVISGPDGLPEAYVVLGIFMAFLWILRVILRKKRCLLRKRGSIIPLILEMPVFILVLSWNQVKWSELTAFAVWQSAVSKLLFVGIAAMLLNGLILVIWRFRNRRAFTGGEFLMHTLVLLIQVLFLYLIMI